MPSPPATIPTTAALTDQAGPAWYRIYVGVLNQVQPDPNASHAVVVDVDAGWGRLTVVTGGPRVAVGHGSARPAWAAARTDTTSLPGRFGAMMRLRGSICPKPPQTTERI